MLTVYCTQSSLFHLLNFLAQDSKHHPKVAGLSVLLLAAYVCMISIAKWPESADCGRNSLIAVLIVLIAAAAHGVIQVKSWKDAAASSQPEFATIHILRTLYFGCVAQTVLLALSIWGVVQSSECVNRHGSSSGVFIPTFSTVVACAVACLGYWGRKLIRVIIFSPESVTDPETVLLCRFACCPAW